MSVSVTDPTARGIGINNLRLWWNSTPMANGGALFDGTTPGFSDAIAYYDGIDPSLVAQIGSITSDIAQSDIRTAYAGLADQDGNKYPLPNEFVGAVVQYSGASTAQIVIGAVTDTGKQVAVAAAVAGGGYLIFLGIAALIAVGGLSGFRSKVSG